MQKSSLPTDYAPAERYGPEKIKAQAGELQKYPFIKELTNAIPETFIILNDKRQIVYANQATLKILGLETPATLYGKRPGEAFSCIYSNETCGCGTTKHCKYCGAVNAILSSIQGNSNMQECRITQEAGNALDLRVWCMPILFHETTYSIMVAQNIENEKRREILEKTFFHDLLNTINGLVGLIDLLKETSENNCDDFRDLLDISTRTLIEEIYAQKDLMSAESNNLQIIKSSFNSFSALEETAAIYKRHEVTGEKNISIDPTSCQIKIFTDKGLLTRTIGNMIKNALEASHNGETVTLGCKQTDEKNIEFWVHNKRPMSREAQLQVFQRSYSTKGKGHGIGTWSVKLLTEQYLNGKASFTSSEEEGTIFRISIPIGSKSDLDILE